MILQNILQDILYLPTMQCWLPNQFACGFFLNHDIPYECRQERGYYYLDEVLEFSFPKNFSLGDKSARTRERQLVINNLVQLIDDTVDRIAEKMMVKIRIEINQLFVDICVIRFPEPPPLVRQGAVIALESIEDFFWAHSQPQGN